MVAHFPARDSKNVKKTFLTIFQTISKQKYEKKSMGLLYP